MTMHRISGIESWRVRSFPRPIWRKPLASSMVTFSTARSTCGRSSRRGRCWATQIIAVRSPVSICAVREGIREAVSQVRPATMQPGKSCAISSANASPGLGSTGLSEAPRRRLESCLAAAQDCGYVHSSSNHKGCPGTEPLVIHGGRAQSPPRQLRHRSNRRHARS
jgi:hypothetical protein